jgi:cytochrome c5
MQSFIKKWIDVYQEEKSLRVFAGHICFSSSFDGVGVLLPSVIEYNRFHVYLLPKEKSMKSSTLLLGAFALASVAALSACNKKDADASATTSVASASAVVAAAPAAAENTIGKTIYGKTCSMCHAANVAGAPKPGDKADWAPRIAQGVDVLYKHAIEGFTGAKGQMPARGGAPNLSDEDVKATVDFMVAQSR